MIDVEFPIIEYASGRSYRQWGQFHGESYREAIRELVEIRTALLREKNPLFSTTTIAPLAARQWQATLAYDTQLANELAGIAEGAAISLDQLVVLNNYTDFRDLELTDEGCSTVYFHKNGNRIAGQTWDMHGSAKRYLCCIKIPAEDDRDLSIVLSIVGCVGMMGYTSRGSMVGVNNINTDQARPAVLWPVVIRKLIHAKNLNEQRQIIRSAPLSSGRTFLLADQEGGEFWEAMPDLSECVGRLGGMDSGHLFHTNHCLGSATRLREVRQALSSTTHTRFQLLERKIGSAFDKNSGWDLLNDHEGYPRSICSNFQTTSVDPSITCGGAIGDLGTTEIRMWRGDKLHDASFIERTFCLRSN